MATTTTTTEATTTLTKEATTTTTGSTTTKATTTTEPTMTTTMEATTTTMAMKELTGRFTCKCNVLMVGNNRIAQATHSAPARRLVSTKT